ncbi:hypothetical protein Tco_0933620, partial [Tanacetum coccineum]
LWYPKDSPFDLEAYTDSDYAGASLDRKSTTRANCYGQVLWIQNQMLDYGYNFMNTKIFIDNESTICIVKNLVFHSKTKHIEIRHHFIKDSYEKRLIQVIKIHTDHNVADLLTKALDVSHVGEGSGQPTEPQHTPTTASLSNIEPIPIIASSSQPQKTHKHRKTKRPTEISQSSRPTTLVAYEIVHEERGDIMEKVATIASSLDADSGSGPRRQDTILGDKPAQTRFERLSKQSNDLPLLGVNTPRSGEDRLKIMELIEICTKLSDRVLALENVKTAQDLEIASLKKRVKKLEKKKKARTPQLKRRLFKGRNIAESDQDEEISFVQEDAETQGRYDQDIEVTTVSAPITTAGVYVSTAEPSTPPPTTTTTVIEDEYLIIAQTLMTIEEVRNQKKMQKKEDQKKNLVSLLLDQQ